MRRASLLIAVAIILCCTVPVANAISMEINATPLKAHIGDTIKFNGKISGLTTIAVYLFIIGPDLDNRGVTLENLNIPAGRGLFTTAPVNMSDGTWEYVWDTSVILGTLKPGAYTVYAVSTAFDRFRYAKGEYATTEVEFLPSGTPTNNVPIDTIIPLTAVITTIAAVSYAVRRRRF